MFHHLETFIWKVWRSGSAEIGLFFHQNMISGHHSGLRACGKNIFSFKRLLRYFFSLKFFQTRASKTCNFPSLLKKIRLVSPLKKCVVFFPQKNARHLCNKNYETKDTSKYCTRVYFKLIKFCMIWNQAIFTTITILNFFITTCIQTFTKQK